MNRLIALLDRTSYLFPLLFLLKQSINVQVKTAEAHPVIAVQQLLSRQLLSLALALATLKNLSLLIDSAHEL